MEYRVLRFSDPIDAEHLNALASEGWRLVAIVPWNGVVYFYFVRGEQWATNGEAVER